MDPESRKALIRSAARDVFADRGYAACGLAEIAVRAEVSKTLLYHYYAEGRPQLFGAVMEDVFRELLNEVRRALRAPLEPAARLRRLVDAFLSFFATRPDAFRLLFREPWGSSEPVLVRQAVETQMALATEMVAPMASWGSPGPTVVAATAGAVGLLTSLTELLLAGQVDPSVAADTAMAFLVGGMEHLADPPDRPTRPRI